MNLGVDANCFAEEAAGCGVPLRPTEVVLEVDAGFAEDVDARKRRGVGVFMCQQ